MVQPTLPCGLKVDTFNRQAWLGIVPFFVDGVRPILCPPLPKLSSFLECNVRTYVYDSQGRPGVWFYSLDANHWVAVKLARAWFHLAYFHAEISASVAAGHEIDYSVLRRGTVDGSRFVYRPTGVGRVAPSGSQEFFLLERYRIFSQDETGHLFTARVAHAPYYVSPVDVPMYDDRLLRLAGFEANGRAPDALHLASEVDVEVFPPERVAEKVPEFVGEAEALGEQPSPA